jgi:hypothetical protein
MNCPDTIPPTDARAVGEAIRAISADPSTLAVLYVHQGMRLERCTADLRAMGAELAEWRSRAIAAEASVDVLRESLQKAMERVDVLGGAA